MATIYQCNICGAEADSPENIFHKMDCEIGFVSREYYRGNLNTDEYYDQCAIEKFKANIKTFER